MAQNSGRTQARRDILYHARARARSASQRKSRGPLTAGCSGGRDALLRLGAHFGRAMAARLRRSDSGLPAAGMSRTGKHVSPQHGRTTENCEPLRAVVFTPDRGQAAGICSQTST
ncbi:hypothetical protein MTO96_013846 [Rhipicephalus appendiculatus]